MGTICLLISLFTPAALAKAEGIDIRASMPSESEVSLWVSPRLRLWLGVVGAGVAAGLAWLGWKITRRSQQVTVAALYVYPIKGCRGHSLAKAKVTKWGLENDRTGVPQVAYTKSDKVSRQKKLWVKLSLAPGYT